MYTWNYIINDEDLVKRYNNWSRALSEHQLMIDKQLADSTNDITYNAYERDEDVCEEEEEEW